MVSTNFFLPIVILGFFHLAVISAQNISCYECIHSTIYENNTACMDPMNRNNISQVSCPSSLGCLRVSFNTLQIPYFARGCNSDNYTCEAVYNEANITYPTVTNFKCLHCRTDRCNSGTNLAVTLTSLFVGMIAAKIL